VSAPATAGTDPSLDRRRGRGRIAVLVTSQVLGGVGVASGIAVGGLLAQQVSGSTALSGLAQTSAVLGAALLAVPMARLAVRRGRGVALATGYGCGLLGAVLAICAATIDQFWLLLIATALFGGGTAAGLQARYAATDGVPQRSRATALSIVVWATTIGSVAGPNLSSVGGELGDVVGVPRLAGPYLFSCIAFGAAAMVVLLRRRTLAGQDGADLPAVSRAAAATPAQGTWSVLRVVWSLPRARAGLAAVSGAHAVMVGVMVMTPVHLGDHGATLEVIGLALSAHIAAMYALSPLVGWAADRLGARTVIGVGVMILVAAVAVGATASEDAHLAVGVALTLLGLGWSCCMVAGSALLSGSVPAQVRTQVQGAGDLVTGMAAVAAGVLAGPLLASGGYARLNLAAMVILVPVVLALLLAPAPAGKVADLG